MKWYPDGGYVTGLLWWQILRNTDQLHFVKWAIKLSITSGTFYKKLSAYNLSCDRLETLFHLFFQMYLPCDSLAILAHKYEYIFLFFDASVSKSLFSWFDEHIFKQLSSFHFAIYVQTLHKTIVASVL